MWNYEKRLEYPINIKQTNPALAAMIISQYGGPYFNKVYTIESHCLCGIRDFRKFKKMDFVYILCVVLIKRITSHHTSIRYTVQTGYILHPVYNLFLPI